MTAAELARLLAERTEDVAKLLLPNGKQEGREWVVGSTGGEAGRSCKVCISGSKVGVWSDFATGEGGDMLDLWAVTKGIGISEAMRQVADFLGVSLTVPASMVKTRDYRKPIRPKTIHKLRPDSPALDYLINQRGISVEALQAYQIAEATEIKVNKEIKAGPWLTFPFKGPDGELNGIKYIHVELDGKGKKQIQAEGGCRPTLFGWTAIDKKARTVVICEGEIDAMTLWDYGYPALSVPFGGGKGLKQQWIAHEYDNLSIFDEIYLCLDGDEEGQIATEEIASRLGVHRCTVVTLPKKDANACRQQGITKDQIDKCFAEAEPMRPPHICEADEFAEGVELYYRPPGGKLPGMDLPWKGRYEQPVRLIHGQLSIWTGFSGSGKTTALSQVLSSGIAQGESVMLGSFEMTPVEILSVMAEQTLARAKPNGQHQRQFFDWVRGRLLMINVQGIIRLEQILESFRYGYQRYGCRVFVIDSLMRCGVAEDDYVGQANFVSELVSFSKEMKVHVHLVAHSRKKADEQVSARKHDIKGSGTMTDLAFNVFCVHRNRRKQEFLETIYLHGATALPKDISVEDVNDMPDSFIICDKHRADGSKEGSIGLDFDKGTKQFTGIGKMPTPYYDGELVHDIPDGW